jgi:hypothetical protein
MSRETISQTVAARLHATEAAIDAALIEAGQLVALLPAARAQAYLSAVAGGKAFDCAAGAITALTQARSQIVETHSALAVLARRMGLGAVAVGILDKPEDEPPVGGGGVTATLTSQVNKRLTRSL